MKRTRSFVCLPSPEYSEPEPECKQSQQINVSPKKTRLKESTNQLQRAIGDEILEFIEPGTQTKRFQKLILSESRNLVVIFFGVMNSYMSSINESYDVIRQCYNVDIFGVSANSTANEYRFPIVNSPKISRNFNVLDPMGGGVYPRDIIIVFDSNGVEKVQIPVMVFGKCVLDRPVVDALVDALEHVQLESQ